MGRNYEVARVLCNEAESEGRVFDFLDIKQKPASNKSGDKTQCNSDH
jgi:hypothetical protein